MDHQVRFHNMDDTYNPCHVRLSTGEKEALNLICTKIIEQVAEGFVPVMVVGISGRRAKDNL